MIQAGFHSYSVKIVDKTFTADKDVFYPQTAVVSFYNIQGQMLFAEDYGHLPTDQIYDLIEKSELVDLDYCYVKNFSFTAYRRTHILQKKDTVKLKSLSARHAFFDSEYTIDFSHLEIEPLDIDFSGCCFASGELTFASTNFGNGSVDFSYAIFRGVVTDFSNSIFGSGEVIFKNAFFSESLKNFQYTDFGEGSISFVNTDFGDGEVSFLNTHFNEGDVSFKVARFGNGKIDFHFSKFSGGDISFERTNFGTGEVDFKTVEFGKGKVNFNRAIFGAGDITFEASAADGRITFKKTAFGNGNLSFDLAEYENTELNLEKATFGECDISFFKGKYASVKLKGCHINHYVDIRVQKCPVVDLSDTIIRDIIDFKPFECEVDIDILDISAMRLLGLIYIDWHRNNVHKLITAQKHTTYAEKAEQFRVLKESFREIGQYNDEDHSYVWFKRFEAKSEFAEIKQNYIWKRLYELPVHRFKKLVFDYAGLYATDPFRVMLSMVVAYVMFSLIYVVVMVTDTGGVVSGLGEEHALLGVVGRGFYHSGITFLTIGYGDFYPMGAVRWLSNVEGFVGVFLMSYFTVAFVRKILR
ncbi:MAG: potassium channel family protein [Salinivirgaceae bacterium]|jgi:hypothetical protein|nr:potassium channel family protein [Salinivirgaceae bacterium]